MDERDAGTLDEALLRLHATGPEFEGWLTNHAPMAVEALVRRGQGARVHRWVDGYARRLTELPGRYGRVTGENWRAALGDPRYLADWAVFFGERLAEAPWRAVLAEWWPRLLPGIAGGATHPVIRVGHAVRVLLRDGETAPRLAELAHGLGYWAARHEPLPDGVARPAFPGSAGDALRAVRRVPDASGGIRHRLAQLTALPGWGEGGGPGEREQERLAELVGAATAYYATHAHGSPVMLVHAATAPNAVLRVLPALPRELWAPSVAAAWSASAAVVAAYAPAGGPVAAGSVEAVEAVEADGEELFARAAAHGDEHAIKLVDTALDVAAARPGDGLAGAAALRALALIDPLTG